MQKIAAFLLKQLSRLHVPEGVVTVIGWLVLAAIVILFVVVLVYLVLRLVAMASSRDFERRPRHQRVNIPSSSVSQASVLEAAQADAAAGRYREAFRGIYLAAILALDRSKLVKYADGITNWEYLRALGRQENQDATKAFAPMTASFDEMIYGKRQITVRDYNECMARYRALEETL